MCIDTLWFDGIGRLPVTSAALLGLLSPSVAALLGAIFLGQLLGPVQVLGFALALAAIAAGQFNPTGHVPIRAQLDSTRGRTPS